MRYLSFLLLSLLLLSNCTPEKEPMTVETGVELTMAQQRAANITNLNYNLFFDIPLEKDSSVAAQVTLSFDLENVGPGLQLDFKEAANHIHQVEVNGEAIDIHFEKEHIIIADAFLQPGSNTIAIDFTAGELSLNRNEEYLYTLLVPDRARTVFPCFDQPNLKATYELSLEIPAEWEASANGAKVYEEAKGNRRKLTYRKTKPVSTYLFAFAAGAFQKKTTEQNGRTMTMLYRESDTIKVNANAQEIFSLHAHALDWLEEYTGIPYPFEKFDFVLIPTFQYGGMEHVGNIFYREGSLMLDEGASINRQLGRASLIAHETAHMWFGDLVTMDWFSDVWLKEVFANFMAAKIVNPSFPEVNHELRFLLAHQPSAYGEDRSQGSHPIQQPLSNLKDAGTLYGRIIYQKAPVVMEQLEAIIGEDKLQEGLQEYLKTFSFGNATWDDLINILDQKTEMDLNEWSTVWVKEPHMPEFRTDVTIADGKITQYKINQLTTSVSEKIWQEATTVALFYEDEVLQFPVTIDQAITDVPEVVGQKAPLAILSNGSPISYGHFELSEDSRDYLLENYGKIEDPVLRGATLLSLYEQFLSKGFPNTEMYFEGLLGMLASENERLNRQRLLSQVSNVYWQFLTEEERTTQAPILENLLWNKMQEAPTAGDKKSYFNSYQSIAISNQAIEKLEAIHQKSMAIDGLRLSESDYISLASALALRLPEKANGILAQELERIKNPDRKRRFDFIRPALSPNEGERDAFFESLKDPKNREVEPWAGSALSYLNHPLRRSTSAKYILPSLALMEEIQETGDIFFPRRWAGAALGGHNSEEAAKIVRTFLEERPDYPPRLKNKILMAADMLYRASE